VVYIHSAFAYSKYMPIRMSNMHLADTPRHIGRWESDIQPSGNALPMDFVNVIHPNRHPRALVRNFISIRPKRRGVRPLAAASLAAQAKKYLGLT
jgi:hypothetical protein